MKKKRIFRTIWIGLLVISVLSGCGGIWQRSGNNTVRTEYDAADHSLKRNGLALHLREIHVAGTDPDRNILLIHGVTYSSQEFDINYEDYSLARKLAGEGYRTWLLDIAGFGQSESVPDGFLPDSDYAAEDIHAAAETIIAETGQDKIDILGWSWGTVTVSRFVAAHPELVNKVVLYAPILSGIGEYEVNEPFHHNTWEHAVDDFQRTEDGSFDQTVTDPAVVEYWCSSCWRYDGESSPNGGRRDICVDRSEELIDLSKIQNQTLVICGDQDPYLNYEFVQASLDRLPEGSSLEMIEGGSHMVYMEKPYYHDFQNRLLKFLNT
ncbi:MAG: alpha/beta hydrolase [Solobacterium sp.]|nr:alpha/beta hydrolase [Solobacterium sp.]